MAESLMMLMIKWYEKHRWQVKNTIALVIVLLALPLALLITSSGKYSLLPVLAAAIGLSGFGGIRFWSRQINAGQKQIEDSLQQREECLRLALETAGLGIWDWNILTNQVTLFSNNASLFGLPQGTLRETYSNFLKWFHPDDRQRIQQTLQQAIQTQQQFEQEFRTVWADGSIHWIAATSQVVCDERGQAVRVVGTARDITERKQTELAFQRLTAKLEEQIQERTAQFQQAIDFEAMLKRITDKVRDSLDEAQILQTTVEELGLGLGVKCCSAALYDLDRQSSTIYYEYNPSLFSDVGQTVSMVDLPEIYQRLLHGEPLQFCNLFIDPIRGRVAILACPIFDHHGVLGDLRLINDKDYAFRKPELRFVQQVANQCAIAIRQARLYQESQAQVKVLEQLNWLKDDFVSMVSHELRTPVTNMKLSIRMLELALSRQETAQPKASQYLQILRDECEREICLINDLLDLQQLELGKRSLVFEAISLKDWLPQVAQPFIERATARQQRLHLDIASESSTLVCDPSILDRIIAELLNNACKYTPPGESITVSTQAVAGKMQIKVSNWGAEISPNEMSRIFDKFYRIPSGDPWKQGGTGLGLALVQRLTELLEGTIQVQSGDRQTCFIVELPNAEQQGYNDAVTLLP